MAEVIKRVFWTPDPECYMQLEIYEGFKLGYLELVDVGEYVSYQWTRKGLTEDRKSSRPKGIRGTIALVIEKNKGKWQGMAAALYCPCESCQNAIPEEEAISISHLLPDTNIQK